MTEEPPGPPSGGYPPPPPGGYPPPPPPGGGYYPPPPGYGTQQPSNNLVWAILVTVFCCLPLGVVSIVKSTQVSGLWAQGQYAQAQAAADDAKKWAIWGAIAGVVVYIIVVIINVAAMSTTPS